MRKRWGENAEVNVLHADPLLLGLYLNPLLLPFSSPSGIDMTVSSISWMHRVSGLSDSVKESFAFKQVVICEHYAVLVSPLGVLGESHLLQSTVFYWLMLK